MKKLPLKEDDIEEKVEWTTDNRLEGKKIRVVKVLAGSGKDLGIFKEGDLSEKEEV